jgi:hypothetical protein
MKPRIGIAIVSILTPTKSFFKTYMLSLTSRPPHCGVVSDTILRGSVMSVLLSMTN